MGTDPTGWLPWDSPSRVEDQAHEKKKALKLTTKEVDETTSTCTVETSTTLMPTSGVLHGAYTPQFRFFLGRAKSVGVGWQQLLLVRGLPLGAPTLWYPAACFSREGA